VTRVVTYTLIFFIILAHPSVPSASGSFKALIFYLKMYRWALEGGVMAPFVAVAPFRDRLLAGI
jgi:hypothetical protein